MGGDCLQQWLGIHQAVASAMADAVQIAAEHITVLGSAVGGDYAVELAVAAEGHATVNQSHGSPLAARSRKASKLARGLIAMAEGQLASGGKQPAWTVMRDCLANALSYDARVCKSVHCGPFAAILRRELTQVVTAIAGAELGPMQTEQIFLRREDGGMDVNDPVASGARARVAAVIERGPDLRARLRLLFPEAAVEAHRGAEGLADAETLVQQMRQQGIAVGPYGLPPACGHSPPECGRCIATTSACVAPARRVQQAGIAEYAAAHPRERIQPEGQGKAPELWRPNGRSPLHFSEPYQR